MRSSQKCHSAMETMLAGYWKSSSRAAITERLCRISHRVTPSAFCHMASAKKDVVWSQFYPLLDG